MQLLEIPLDGIAKQCVANFIVFISKLVHYFFRILKFIQKTCSQTAKYWKIVYEKCELNYSTFAGVLVVLASVRIKFKLRNGTIR